MHRKVAAALVAALALGVASCGADKPPTKAQFVRRIELACRQGQQVSQQHLRATQTASGNTSENFVAAAVAGQRVAVDRIEALTPSDGAKDDFDTLKDGMKARADLFHRVQSAPDVQRAISAAQAKGEAITQRVQQAATRLGVRGCI